MNGSTTAVARNPEVPRLHAVPPPPAPDPFWPRLGRAAAVLGVAIGLHVWLVHPLKSEDGAVPSVASPTAAPLSLARVVAEPPVKLIHDFVVAHVIGKDSQASPAPGRFEPPDAIQRALLRNGADRVAGTTGITVATNDVGTRFPAAAEPMVATAGRYQLMPADSAILLPEISYAAPLSVLLDSKRLPELAPPAGRAAAARSDASPAGGELDKQRQVIRGVLGEYARAYERLDVRGAKALNPSLDDRALKKAFAGLEAQQLRLADCDVSIRGRAANVQCVAEATYHTRVGSRMLARKQLWTFDLSRHDNGWEIVQARTR
jgi:hypothetical protein